jgi:hypothetical protein
MGAEKLIADAVFGEGANQPIEVRKMIASTIINRLNSSRKKEFGETPEEVLNRGFYAVSNPNVPYKQASAQKFPDKKSENIYKETLQLVSGMLKGKISPDKGEFYFTNKEIVNLKKNPKRFDFAKVKHQGKSGDYQVFSY